MAAPEAGGFKISLGSLKANPRLKASPLQKDTKRPRLALGEDEPDDANKKQEIVGWDTAEGGALDAGGKKEKEAPRIIPSLPDRDWRAEARRKHAGKTPHQETQNGGDVKKVEESKIQYGLTIVKKAAPQEDDVVETAAVELVEDEKDNLTEEQRLEKKALDALLNGKPTDNGLVIPIQADEEDNFLDDIRNAPDAPTLEAYEATPIEGFGAAMLRGMGWKDDDTTGNKSATAKPQTVKRRPALLGIGAKDEAATGVELEEFGGKGKGKGKKIAQAFNPVALRNKHTGELITEEELKAKLENQNMVPEEEADKGRRRYDGEEEKDDDRREKPRERRDDKDRHRDRRRDDDYDSDRRQARRRDRGGDYESDHAKTKRRDYDRDKDYDSERRKERRRDGSRSRSPDRRKDKHRDRYRSRSRDAKQKRDRRDGSRDSEDRRKRRRDREYEYDDDRDDRKRRHRDERYRK